MRKKILIVFLLIICVNVSFAEDKISIPLVTNRADLDLYVGKVITLRGQITNTKIPTIIGVDVGSDNPDLRGNIGEATGILEKWTVTKDELERIIKEKGMFQNRGPGTFYCLKEVDSNYTAQVRR